MEEFLSNISQNRTMMYFAIIFAILWVGGMLWAIVLVLRHLGKKRRSLSALKSVGFNPIDNNRILLGEIKNIFANTLGDNFIRRVDENPRKELMKFHVGNRQISVTYNIPKTEFLNIPRPVGVKEAIQIVERQIILSKLLFMEGSNFKAFYAQTDDIETIRVFQEIKPINKKRSTIGWVICFYAKTDYTSTICIYRKFTGHRRLLMNMAFKMANIKPADSVGLSPDFKKEFEVKVTEMSQLYSIIDEKTQHIILAYKEYIPEGIKLFLGKNGVWLTGEEWLDNKQISKVVELCNNLI